VIDGKLKLKHASAADSDMNKNKKNTKNVMRCMEGRSEKVLK